MNKKIGRRFLFPNSMPLLFSSIFTFSINPARFVPMLLIHEVNVGIRFLLLCSSIELPTMATTPKFPVFTPFFPV